MLQGGRRPGNKVPQEQPHLSLAESSASTAVHQLTLGGAGKEVPPEHLCRNNAWRRPRPLPKQVGGVRHLHHALPISEGGLSQVGAGGTQTPGAECLCYATVTT